MANSSQTRTIVSHHLLTRSKSSSRLVHWTTTRYTVSNSASSWRASSWNGAQRSAGIVARRCSNAAREPRDTSNKSDSLKHSFMPRKLHHPTEKSKVQIGSLQPWPASTLVSSHEVPPGRDPLQET